MSIIHGNNKILLKRTSINQINNIFTENPEWKILDIGCGYTANKYSTILADVQDLSDFYTGRKFVKINDSKLPFKDNEFDFVIASHVIEHVKDIKQFISELERISKKGYIELPSRLGDNLIFENVKDHIWWFVYDDSKNLLIGSKKDQFVEPFITVSTGQTIQKMFRESMVIELMWEKKIDLVINDSIKPNNFSKISFFKLIKKYFSKKFRTIVRKKRN